MYTSIDRVLITGGTGFIGSAMAERLLARGVAVDILSRDRRRVETRFAGRARGIESLDELASEPPPQVIVNLAGMNLAERRWNERAKAEFVRSRLDVTRRVIAWIERTRPQPSLLISASAVGYYGARGEEVVDESSEPGQEYQSQLCMSWERAAEQAADLGVRTCIARIGVVIGAGGALAQALPIFRLGLGAVIGTGSQWLSWIALEDLLRMCDDFMTDTSLAGPFNMTAPNPVTNRQFVKTLGKVLHRPVIMRIPAPVYRLIFGEVAHLHLTGQRAMPSRHCTRGFEFRYPMLEGAVRAAIEK